MQMFFYICDYLDISPMDFFAAGDEHRTADEGLAKELKTLSDEKFKMVSDLVKML